MSVNVKTADGLVNLGVTNPPTPHWFGTIDDYIEAKKNGEISIGTIVFIDESVPSKGEPVDEAGVLNGKEFYDAAGQIKIGTMPDNSTTTSNGNVPGASVDYPQYPVRNGELPQILTNTDGIKRFIMCPPRGYYQGGGGSYIGMPASDFGNAPDYAVVQGYTFTSEAGFRRQGVITDNGGWTATATTYGKIGIPYGYHDGSGYVDTSLLGDRRIDGKIITIPFSNSLDTGLKSTAGGTIGATGSVSGALKIQLYFDDDNTLKVKIYSNDTNITIRGKARLVNDYGTFNYVSDSKTEKLNLSSEPVIS